MKIGGVTTTERCNLSCKMCPFNGPAAPRRNRTLQPEVVEQFIHEVDPGEDLWFAGTGEFFLDPHAVHYLRRAAGHGLRPHVLTNGQLLTPRLLDDVIASGTKTIRISVDAYDEATYAEIRRGGSFSRIMAACAHLRDRRLHGADIRVEISNTLLAINEGKERSFVEFWRGKADQVNFNAEYHDTFRFRNLFFQPKERVDCDLQLYLLPSGRVSPCCAINILQHVTETDWLPRFPHNTLREIHEIFREMYNDPTSPLRTVCAECQWWVLSYHNEAGLSPYWREVHFEPPLPKTGRLRHFFHRLSRRLFPLPQG